MALDSLRSQLGSAESGSCIGQGPYGKSPEKLEPRPRRKLGLGLTGQMRTRRTCAISHHLFRNPGKSNDFPVIKYQDTMVSTMIWVVAEFVHLQYECFRVKVNTAHIPREVFVWSGTLSNNTGPNPQILFVAQEGSHCVLR